MSLIRSRPNCNGNAIPGCDGNETSKSKKNLIRLPELSPTNKKLNYSQIRAIADSKSLRHRFSDLKTLKKFEPDGNISKQLYKISEKISSGIQTASLDTETLLKVDELTVQCHYEVNLGLSTYETEKCKKALDLVGYN